MNRVRQTIDALFESNAFRDWDRELRANPPVDLDTSPPREVVATILPGGNTASLKPRVITRGKVVDTIPNWGQRHTTLAPLGYPDVALRWVIPE
jgi:hypothetical protein